MKKDQTKARHEYDVVVKILSHTTNERFVHIYDGDVPKVNNGAVYGTEMVGKVVHKGKSAHSFSVGEYVKINCITKCKECYHADEHYYITESGDE